MGDGTVTRAPAASQRKPPSSKTTRIVVAAAALAAGLGVTVWALRATDRGGTRSDVPETTTEEPPPDFPQPRTEAERLQRVLEVLLSGDAEEAAWARGLLATGGEPARTLVAETARRALVSNRAFVEHAFDILLRDPRQGDVPLASEALDNPNPEVVQRACILLGRAGGPLAREQMPRMATLVASGWPLSRFAMEALVALGGDDAVAQLERISLGREYVEGERDAALPRIGKIGGEKARAILLRELAAAKTDARKIAAAEGLVAMGDATPVTMLRTMWQVQRDERAVTLLARAKDDLAFAEFESRVRAPIETEERRIQALTMLDPFPAERRRDLLRFAGAAPMPREVRIEALTQLWHAGDASDGEQMLRMLRKEGKDAREDRMIAALVLGRIRDPAHTKALLIAEEANRADSELRTILLRAVLLSGGAGGAEAVARAMAEDASPHGTLDSVAYQLSLMVAAANRPTLDAMAPAVRDALAGRLGKPGPMALGSLIRLAPRACGPEIGPVLEPYLVHEDPQLREAAADALVECPGDRSVAAMKNAWWKQRDDLTRQALRRSLERVVLVRPVK